MWWRENWKYLDVILKLQNLSLFRQDSLDGMDEEEEGESSVQSDDDDEGMCSQCIRLYHRYFIFLQLKTLEYHSFDIFFHVLKFLKS